jgi:glycosyltransferase involved in cell wall biosynthesis
LGASDGTSLSPASIIHIHINRVFRRKYIYMGLVKMIIGVFSPSINLCGGAEWVAINIICALKEQGHKVVLLSDSPINQKKFTLVFDRTVSVDQQLIFPLIFFSQTDPHNLYTDALRTIVLKTKCEILVDTYSNAILPGSDVAYIHYPLLTSVKQGLPYWRNKAYFSPYQDFLNSHKLHIAKKLILANSKFTAQAASAEFGVDVPVLYPSFPNRISAQNVPDLQKPRYNNVAVIARISGEKNLQIIPHIAKLASKNISFTIAGLLSSRKVLLSLSNLIKELKVSDRVKILTNVTREQAREISLNSKVFLHTKEKEHFGIAIVEAMSLGCIPIVHDSGGPREFVPERFRFRSIEDAASKLEDAIDSWSPAQARKFSISAERFNEDNFSKQFIDLLNEHLQRNKK